MIYKNVRIHGQKLDLVVETEVVLEIKSLQKLPEVAEAQILSDLRATGLKRGLLINFGERLLVNGIKRYSL